MELSRLQIRRGPKHSVVVVGTWNLRPRSSRLHYPDESWLAGGTPHAVGIQYNTHVDGIYCMKGEGLILREGREVGWGLDSRVNIGVRFSVAMDGWFASPLLAIPDC
jgi:hypothetical protein